MKIKTLAMVLMAGLCVVNPSFAAAKEVAKKYNRAHADSRAEKCKRDCGKVHVISHLPYVINEPGQYCLGANFTWKNDASSAITILDVDNVALNFNQRAIKSAVASSTPLISVMGSRNIEINDMHLRTSEDAKNLAQGLYIESSANVQINTPVLFDIGGSDSQLSGIMVADSDGITIKDAYANNFDLSLSRAFYFVDSSNIRFTGGNLKNAPIQFQHCQFIDIDNLHSDLQEQNDGSWGICIFIRSFNPSDFEPLRPTKNVRISNCELYAGYYGSGIWLFGDTHESYETTTTESVIIEDNVICISTGTAIWLDENNLGCFVRNNQLVTLTGDIPLNPFDFADGIDVVGSRRGLFENNNISCVRLIPETPANVGSVGIALFTDPDDGGTPTEFNTVRGNVVTGCSMGYTDNLVDVYGPNSLAACTVFRDNIATGNVINMNNLEPSTILVDNTFGCELDMPVATFATTSETGPTNMREIMIEMKQKALDQ